MHRTRYTAEFKTRKFFGIFSKQSSSFAEAVPHTLTVSKSKGEFCHWKMRQQQTNFT